MMVRVENINLFVLHQHWALALHRRVFLLDYHLSHTCPFPALVSAVRITDVPGGGLHGGHSLLK